MTKDRSLTKLQIVKKLSSCDEVVKSLMNNLHTIMLVILILNSIHYVGLSLGFHYICVL